MYFFYVLCFVSAGGVAQVQIIIREAENYDRIHGSGPRQWQIVQDDSMAATASGGAYLAALPDTRVTHDDELIEGENFSPRPGRIAVVDYTVDIPATGRYYVWVSAFSRGTEDNGVHVGSDGNWPESGRRMQWCAGKHRWTWASQQRTEADHCGEEGLIYLDVDRPGRHTISFSMREDGFRMDRWALTPTYSAPTRLPESREEILDAYVDRVYGAWPAAEAVSIEATPRTAAIPVLDGLGFRRQFTLHLRSGAQTQPRDVDLLLYYPAKATGAPVPTILNLNFRGNQAIVKRPSSTG
jgi:hypothetical protein